MEQFVSKSISESAKVAIAIKTARTALGLSQLEFSKKLGISKTTLARVETFETFESQILLSFYIKATNAINELGIYFEAVTGDDIVITIKPQAQQMAIDALADEANRRSDRKKK